MGWALGDQQIHLLSDINLIPCLGNQIQIWLYEFANWNIDVQVACLNTDVDSEQNSSSTSAEMMN